MHEVQITAGLLLLTEAGSGDRLREAVHRDCRAGGLTEGPETIPGAHAALSPRLGAPMSLEMADRSRGIREGSGQGQPTPGDGVCFSVFLEKLLR